MKKARPEVVGEPTVLDWIRKRLGLVSDYALANWLGVDRTTVYAIRAGRCHLSPTQRMKILDGARFLGDVKISDLLDPDALAARLIQARNGTVVSHPVMTVKHFSPDARLLEVCKVLHGFRNDRELALHLRVSRQFVTSIRAGNQRLGVLLRLHLLAEDYPQPQIARLRQALTAPAGELMQYLAAA
ncbi:MAG: hypothetical protein ACYC9L_06155 [Sulfuricaulis sp.]